MSAGFHAGFQASRFDIGRAFADAPVEDVALDWDCWPLVAVDEVDADVFLLGSDAGVLMGSMKEERGPGVSTVGLRPV